MSKFHVFLLVAGIAFASGASLQESSATRIVGGTDTTIENYPYLVQIEAKRVILEVWSSHCAANIITTRYLLSAAHCFDGLLYSPSLRRVRAGATQRGVGGQVIDLEDSINHPTYGLNGEDGDISLLLLSYSLEYNPVVQPATIVAQGWQVPDDIEVIYAGWGDTSEDGSLASVLQEVTVNTVNREVCRELYANIPGAQITDNMICAGLPEEGGKDACTGDSGGPVYYDNYLIGIISFGNGCARAGYPGVNTAVSSYTDWILELTGSPYA